MGKRPPGDVKPPAGPEAPEPPPLPTPSERSKAYKMRSKLRAGIVLLPTEQDWLDEYEARQRARGGPDVGASASERVIHVEERHAAVGTGEAATAAAAASAIAKEEGRRLDALIQQATAALTSGMNAMGRASELYASMAENMLADRMQDREEMRTLMQSVRAHYLARIDAEAEARQATNSEQDQLSQVLQLLQELRGVPRGPRVVPDGKTSAGGGGSNG